MDARYYGDASAMITGGPAAAATTAATTHHTTQQFYSAPVKHPESRWTRDSRVMLKNLMCQLSREDVGSAFRVVIEAYGVQASKIVRRGDYIELDLNEVDDDFILDNLYEYCYTVRQSQQPQQVTQDYPPTSPGTQYMQQQQQQQQQQAPQAQVQAQAQVTAPVQQQAPQHYETTSQLQASDSQALFGSGATDSTTTRTSMAPFSISNDVNQQTL